MTEDADMSLAAAQPAPTLGLSIVVPVYRGASTVGALVSALAALRPEGGIEVVLVNDGSPDNSAEVCREIVRTAAIPVIYIEHMRSDRCGGLG